MSKSEITKVFSEKLEEFITHETNTVGMYYCDLNEISERIGIPYSTFKSYVDNRSECSITNLYKIASYFEINSDYLIGLSDELGGIYEDFKCPTPEEIASYTNLQVKTIEIIQETSRDDLSEYDEMIQSGFIGELASLIHDLKRLSSIYEEDDYINEKCDSIRSRANEALTKILDHSDGRKNNY